MILKYGYYLKVLMRTTRIYYFCDPTTVTAVERGIRLPVMVILVVHIGLLVHGVSGKVLQSDFASILQVWRGNRHESDSSCKHDPVLFCRKNLGFPMR